MSWLKKQTSKRLEAVGRKRIALAEPYLLPAERVSHNAPLEQIVLIHGQIQTQPVLVFGTDQRVLVVPYDGSAEYLPANDPSDGTHIAIRHQQYVGLPTRRALGEAGSWKGLGALLLSSSQFLALPSSMTLSMFTMRDAANAAGGALGAFGRETVDQLGESLQPPFDRCALFGLPIESSRIDDLLRFIDDRGSFNAGKQQ